MFKRFSIYMLLFEIPVSGLNTSGAQHSMRDPPALRRICPGGILTRNSPAQAQRPDLHNRAGGAFRDHRNTANPAFLCSCCGEATVSPATRKGRYYNETTIL
jgi:hypothetical protein